MKQEIRNKKMINSSAFFERKRLVSLSLLLLALVFLTATSAFAAKPQKSAEKSVSPEQSAIDGKTAKEWSNLIFDRYEKVDSFTADFTQIMLHKESGVEENREGEILFSKPMQVRWQTKPPLEEMIFIGKDFIWHYFPDEELAYKFTLEAMNDQSGFILVLTGQTRLEDRFTIVPKELDSGLMKLHLIPLEPSQSLVEADLWLEPDTGLIRRLLIIDFYANTSEIKLDNEKFNVKISGDKFKFTPPQGTEIEDNTIQNPGTGAERLDG